VISLPALERAINETEESSEPYECVMCLRWVQPPEKRWHCPEPSKPETANPKAVICWDCMQQADRTFAKDPDVDWDRKLAPTQRWR
jgi:hypothetical protein